MKFETARILFLGDVFAAVAVVVRSLICFDQGETTRELTIVLQDCDVKYG